MNEINKMLSEKYGKDLTGKAKFRLVFSDTQTETRIGAYEIWSGDIWLRTETGARVVPKYQALKGRWILEILFRGAMPPDVVSTDPYECLWAFQENQMPVWNAVELIIYTWHNRTRLEKISDDEKKAKEIEDNYIKISNNSPVLAAKLHSGSAVFIDERKKYVRSDSSKSDASPDK